MATVNLGSIKFKWKGTYSGATAYTIDDVVEYNGSSFICISNSTGNLPTNATYFEQMSSAGTNGTDGTDLTTTLTTQGDIVYRDASGLARLPAGSANQVLQSGGTGANPSWGTVSSDYVKLSDTSVSGNPGSVPISDIFTDDYKQYKIFISNYYGQSNSYLNMRFTTTGATQIQSGYHQIHQSAYYQYSTNGGSTAGSQKIHNDSSFYLLPEQSGTDSSNSMYAEITIMNPRQSSEYRWILVNASVRAINNYHYTFNSGGFQNSTGTAYGGLLFFPNTGNMASCDIKIYGIK